MSAIDAVDGSSTGIALCLIAVIIQELLMSALCCRLNRSMQHMR